MVSSKGGPKACSSWWSEKKRGRSEEHTSELQSQSNLVCRRDLPSFPTRRSSDLSAKRDGYASPGRDRSREGALLGMDARRQDVRQLRHPWGADFVRTEWCHQRVDRRRAAHGGRRKNAVDRKSTRLNSSHSQISYADEIYPLSLHDALPIFLQKGTGTRHPAATDRVKVHYSGWTPDGKMFDSSVTRGEPTSFGLNGVIKGWTEGVQLMVVGEKTR